MKGFRKSSPIETIQQDCEEQARQLNDTIRLAKRLACKKPEFQLFIRPTRKTKRAAGTAMKVRGLLNRLKKSGLVLACVLLSSPAYSADLFLEGGLGVTQFQRTTPDGVWWQKPFPHSFDLTDVAWKTGLGVRLNERWSLAGSYVSLGTASARTEAVSDYDYDHGKRNGHRSVVSASDSYAGGQLILSRSWSLGPLQPRLSGGFAYLHHTVTANQTTSFSAWLPTGVIGAGVCWSWVCADVSYYRSVSAPMYPISTQMIVPMLSVNIPLTGW